MAWPSKINHVVCYDFPRSILPIIKMAIDQEMIVWGKCDLFMSYGTGQFTFADCLWELAEMNELVTSIRLLKGNPNSEDLTAAVLKGKIETS
jgi:hypothetical protein